MNDAGVAPAHGFRAVDIADLRERVLPPVLLLLTGAAAVGAWAYLPGTSFRWQECAFFALIAVAGLCVWRLQGAGTGVAGLVLIAAAYLQAVLAARLFGDPVTMLVLIAAVVLATVLVYPWAPPAAAVGAAGLHWGLHTWLAPQPYLSLGILAYLLVGWLLFFSMRSTYQILHWSWRRHADAGVLAEELRDRQGQLNRTIKALDLAYRLLQRTNHELAVAREEAEEARRLKDQFAANISHELRTPLNLILGFSEMMYMSPHIYGDAGWTPPLRRDVAQVYSASRHLSQLVDDVLDLSRLNAERMPMRKELSDLNAVIHEAAATAEDLLRGRPIAIELHLDPAVPRLPLDPTRIRQVVLNLLNNAIRFTERGSVTVRSERRDAGVLVSVRDTGVGIAESELEAIFDEFYQADAAVKGQRPGMGLGLAISRRFVRMHGGRIWAESAVGAGSTFYFQLPLEARPSATPGLRLTRPSSTPANPYRESIVVLGEQPDVARLLERHLTDYRVLHARGAAEARRLIDEYHPRAVLISPPLQAIRRLMLGLAPRDLPPATPVVFAGIPSNAWRAEALGIHAGLQKPVQLGDLEALLRGIEGARDILIVDDDRGFVQMVARYLESREAGYKVRWAYCGEEGLEEMSRRRPDAVLLDLLMPGMGGRQVIERMHEDEALAGVPVITVTAMDVEEDMGGIQLGLVGLEQRDGWGLGDTLGALGDLLRRARPRYATPAEERPAPEAAPAD